MTPQLFCEADRYPIGQCPCVKCKQAVELGKAFAIRRQENIARIARDVFSKHSRLFEKLAPKIIPDRCLPIEPSAKED